MVSVEKHESCDDDQGKRYDKIADGFAKMRDSFYKEKKYLDLFLSYLKPGSSILDVGCGTGFPIASYLIDNHLHVTGVDSSKELLAIAREKCPAMTQIYGDVRTVSVDDKYDGIVEWWCLFHLPKSDHEHMISRFSEWLKPGGILEFTTGEDEYEDKSSDMLDTELDFYSLHPNEYENLLKRYNLEVILRESDQPQHMVWIAKRL